MNALADSPQSLILGLEILANDLYDILCGVAHHDTNTRIGLRRLEDVRSLALLLTVINECHHLLQRGDRMTKRDLYYRHLDLFRTYETVDRTLGRLCTLMKVDRWKLHVVASPKGLIVGDMVLTLKSGQVLFMNQSMNQPHPIPEMESIATIKTDVPLVLVVENEATFSCLLNISLESYIGPHIMLTDIASRRFLRALSRCLSAKGARMVILTDADSYGLEIHQAYLHGKPREHVEELSSPRLEFIGLSMEDWTGDGRLRDQSIQLSPANRSHCLGMLGRSNLGSKERRMIERMLFYGRKAELQCLLQGPEGAVGLGWYLQRKLRLTQPLNEVSL
ncbi:MAG: Spo11/DNA topoisomerase VI subunit A [Piptocephalis tieghemiana]|nr:MAG: Spo11/DNA topoisomerase VI subunit A [Piptocephalis tieghemiana]